MEQTIVERAVEAEIDTKKRIKGKGKLGWFISKDLSSNISKT